MRFLLRKPTKTPTTTATAMTIPTIINVTMGKVESPPVGGLGVGVDPGFVVALVVML